MAAGARPFVPAAETMAPGPLRTAPDRLEMTKKHFSEEEASAMRKLFTLASPAADTAVLAALVAGVCAALLAGRDDIRRFWRIHNM